MNDRFSAQLRRHLVESADERPADGQLASIVDRVADTRQRPAFLAGLAMEPGRVGAVPTAAVRFALIGAALLVAMAAGALIGGAGGPTSRTTVFEGSWITVDPADGSGMTLVIGPGIEPPVYFEDGYASGAACVDDTVKRFTARGTGTVAGDRLVVDFPDGGGCILRTVQIGPIELLHDHVTDTLTDADQLVWYRALDGARPTELAPTQPMPTEPAPTGPAPTDAPPTEPAPTEPAPTDAPPTEPEPTDAAAVAPAPTDAAPTDDSATVPAEASAIGPPTP